MKTSSACLILGAILILTPTVVAPQIQVEVAFPNLKFERPVDLQHPPDGSDRFCVVEKRGVIYVFANDAEVTEKKTFLDVRDRVSHEAPEAGLLGLAFHPDFVNNGYFFVNYTREDTSTGHLKTHVSRFTISDDDPDLADQESELTILTVEQPLEHHNGGQLVFGPDGYLYIGMGDGGRGRNGQDSTTLLGALLRIDVDNPHGENNYGIPEDNPFAGNSKGKEIFAFGLRNPWRFSFDPVTGLIWLGDVGHVRYEEIDIVLPGHNYGWNIMEGAHCYDSSSPGSSATGCDTTWLTLPIWEYGRDMGEAIIGGFVYRGSQVPSLYGKYVYGDFEFGTVWSLDYDGSDPPSNTVLFQMGPWSVTSFGVDQHSELYLCSYGGNVYRIMETPLTVNDQKDSPLPAEFILYPNYPNPFNPITTLRYDTPVRTHVTLTIYDVLGRRVKTLVRRMEDPGYKSIIWDGTDDSGISVSAGVYLYQLRTGKFTQTRKMLLLK